MRPKLVDPHYRAKYIHKIKSRSIIKNRRSSSNSINSSDDLTNWVYIFFVCVVILFGLILYDRYKKQQKVYKNNMIK